MSADEHEPIYLREIVYEPEFDEALGLIFSSIRRADEVLEGLTFFLSRRAELGLAVRGLPLNHASWLSQLLPDRSRVRVLYEYTNDEVVMLDAWLVPFVPEREV